MKQKIIDMLKDSKEVELICANPEGFTSHGHVNESLMDHGKFIIEGYYKDVYNYEFSLRLDDDELKLLNICRDQAYITDYELQYFKIKDPEYTFDDLIDVAVQAAKDGVIIIKHFDDTRLLAITAEGDLHSFEEWRDRSSAEDIKTAIRYVQSLYTKTFVIETEEDVKKVVEGAKIIMANGVEVTACKRIAHLPARTICYQPYEDSHVQYLWFEALKGATVTQKSNSSKNSTTNTEPVQLDLFD